MDFLFNIIDTVSNIPNIDPNINGHNHEEANTLLILHVLDVAKHKGSNMRSVDIGPVSFVGS